MPDLYAPDFPHGAPLGYDLGCRSNSSCPSALERGLSCLKAWERAASDVRVRTMYDNGATPDEVAAHMFPDRAHAASAAAPEPAPAPAVASASAAHAAPVEAPAPAPAKTSKPKPKTKRTPKPRVAAEVIETAKQRAPKTRAAAIRIWAKERGYVVPAVGRIPQHVIDHYDHVHAPETELPAPIIPQETWDKAAAEDEEAAVVRAAFATPTDDDWAGAVARAYPNPTANPGAIAARIPDTRTPAAPSAVNDALAAAHVPEVPPAPVEADAVAREKRERPDWGTVAESVDVERARRLAVRLEQELAKTEDDLAAALKRAETAERAVEVLLEHWDRGLDRIAELQAQVDEVAPLFDTWVPPGSWVASAIADDQQVATWAAANPAIDTGTDPHTPTARTRWQRFLEFFGLGEDS